MDTTMMLPDDFYQQQQQPQHHFVDDDNDDDDSERTPPLSTNDEHYEMAATPAQELRQRTSESVLRVDTPQQQQHPLHRAAPPATWEHVKPRRFGERKRVTSWSSEGEVHRILHRTFRDYEDYGDYDTEEEEDESSSSARDYFGAAAASPTPQKKALTASALALKHGSALTDSQPRLALQRSFVNLSQSQLQQLPVVPAQRRRRSLSPSSPHHHHQRPADKWLIPINHPLKIYWDIVTVILSIVNAYATHRAIRDRSFQARPGFIEVWFFVDILLNFCTQRTNGDKRVLTTFTAVWARYLTSWFVIDVLALFPGEVLYIQPVIELQKRRKLWQKVFRRTKVAVRVTTRILQSGHVPWIYKAVVKARGIKELVNIIRLCIKYIPKYLLFVRNMKGVLVIRALRDLGHFGSFWRIGDKKDDVTADLTQAAEDEDGATTTARAQDWELLEDDSVPLEHHGDDDDDVGPY